jgi:hypothetical protein
LKISFLLQFTRFLLEGKELTSFVLEDLVLDIECLKHFVKLVELLYFVLLLDLFFFWTDLQFFLWASENLLCLQIIVIVKTELAVSRAL